MKKMTFRYTFWPLFFSCVPVLGFKAHRAMGSNLSRDIEEAPVTVVRASECLLEVRNNVILNHTHTHTHTHMHMHTLSIYIPGSHCKFLLNSD